MTSAIPFLLQELSRLIPKSAVGELQEDSSNVLQLIAEAYSVRRSRGRKKGRILKRGCKTSRGAVLSIARFESNGVGRP